MTIYINHCNMSTLFHFVTKTVLDLDYFGLDNPTFGTLIMEDF